MANNIPHTRSIYLDTVTYDKYLKSDANALPAFLKWKSGGWRFFGSIEALAELSANPDQTERKQSVDVLFQLCRGEDFFREPKKIFQSEIENFLNGTEKRYFLTSEDVERERQFIDSRPEAVAEYLKDRKRYHFEKIKSNPQIFGDIAGKESFSLNPNSLAAEWRNLIRSGLVADRLDEWINCCCKYKLDKKQRQDFIERFDAYPFSKALLACAYAYDLGLLMNKKPKWGDNIDSRHLAYGTLCSYFFTCDQKLIDWGRRVQGILPFEAIFPNDKWEPPETVPGPMGL
ncbi:MAG: hypothetical protein HYT79_01430 [Elusimicrobia bacterium]|nr:hypothetical protein [Elusimicrobiota bacterium]